MQQLEYLRVRSAFTENFEVAVVYLYGREISERRPYG